MKIVHWAPFAPSRCGLYEAARDCVHADQMRGHDVSFCDTGVGVGNGQREAAKVGAEDARGGWTLKTASPHDALHADLWVCHDSPVDSWFAMCQVPVVWMIHGRPLACFRPEQDGSKSKPYTLNHAMGTWPRVKKVVTMWAEFMPHWSLIIPPEKLRCTDDPPIDRSRYLPTGLRRPLHPKAAGSINLLVCDSWREDVDIYETAVACLLAAKQRPGTRVHFWAVEPDKPIWDFIWQAFGKINALGEVHPRETEIADVYRSMDLLVSPHVIGVRTIGEALSCALPVVAADGNRYANYLGKIADAEAMADTICHGIDEYLTDPERVKREALEASAAFDLSVFGAKMETIYQEAVNGA